jgi:uncharacterized protein (TIRG00374 family)
LLLQSATINERQERKEDPARRVFRILLIFLRAVIGIGLLVYLWNSGAIQWSALMGLASAWPLTLAALLLLLVAVGFTGWRLCLLLRLHSLQVSVGAALRLTLIGIFFNSFLPGSTGGDLVKIFYAAQGNRGRRTEVVTIVLWDRAAGMFALLIWPLLVAPLFPELFVSSALLRKLLWTAAIIAGAMLAGTLLCFSSQVRNNRLLSLAFRKLPGGDYARRIFETVHHYRHNVGPLALAVVVALITHTLTTGATMLAAHATNPDGIAWEMSLLIPLGHLANTLPVTPGGLGVGEAAFSALFAMVGLRGGAEALLGWRLLTMLIGLLGLLFYLQGRERFVHSAEVSASLRCEL